MQPEPYIGITGPVSIKEVEDICKEFSNAEINMISSHSPMLGFLVSYKTLSNQPTENRRYPLVKELPDLLKATNYEVLTMIHYNSKEMSTLADQIAKIFEFGGVYQDDLCTALQLNVVWPDIDQVAKIKNQFPDMQIVFQASHKATADKTPEEIAERIKKYGNSLDYVLIDPSGGRGIEFDLDSSVALYSELKKQTPNLRVGFAGGFTGENVAPRIKELTKRLGEDNFCIDAEGGLRDKITEAYGDDLLNIEKVRKYLQAWGSL